MRVGKEKMGKDRLVRNRSVEKRKEEEQCVIAKRLVSIKFKEVRS